jgi:hypothetical protein
VLPKAPSITMPDQASRFLIRNKIKRMCTSIVLAYNN